MVESDDRSSGKNPIAQRYSTMGWAIFLILVGLVMILPHALVPEELPVDRRRGNHVGLSGRGDGARRRGLNRSGLCRCSRSS